MIRIEYNSECAAPFAVLVCGDNVKILKNPRLTANMPYWMQQDLINAVLREAGRPVGRKAARQVARVIELDALRVIREERVAKNAHLGR